jgi:hypothetical protein
MIGLTIHPSIYSQETAFYAYKINHLQGYNKTKNRVKQRLFHGNAMCPKGAYFAQDERLSLNLTALLPYVVVVKYLSIFSV